MALKRSPRLVGTKCLGLLSGASLLLSGCAAEIVGPASDIQEQTLRSCAAQLGDKVGALTFKTSVSLQGNQQRSVVTVVESDTVSAFQAEAINNCARDSLVASGLETAPPSAGPASAPRQNSAYFPSEVGVVAICREGNSSLLGGTSYCSYGR